MARPKGSKNKARETPKNPEIAKNDQNGGENGQNNFQNEEKPENPVEKQTKTEKLKEFMTPFEAAEHFGVDEAAIKLWIQHGHLDLTRGGLISMTSIRNCRFKVRKIL